MRIAVVIACLGVAGCESFHHELAPPGSWNLPAAGTEIAVAQSGKGLNSNIERDFLICANPGPISATARVYKAVASGQFAYPDIVIPPGRCLQVATPSAVFLMNYVDQDHTISGAIRAFRRGTFTGDPAVVDGVPSSPTLPAEGRPVSIEATCIPMLSPSAQQNIYSTCVIADLVPGRNYRICFPDKFTPPHSNGEPYPASRTSLVLSPEFLTRPVPPEPAQVLWNPVAANSCRDIFNAQFAAFVIWPWRANNYWQPEKVSKVFLTIQHLH